MKKLTAFIILSVTLLSGCGKTVEEVVVDTKKPFIIETQILGKKQESYSIEKSARITAGSSLVIAAESVGEVTNIAVKEGSKIKKGSRLVSLKDTVNSYDLRVAQAQNSVAIQDASIESTRLSLDQAISSTQIGYEQAKKNYDNLLEKNNLIVDTLKNTNQKTLESYNESYKTYLSSIEGFMTNFLYEGDKILGVTTTFEYANDGWESYLGIRIGNAYAAAKNQWDTTYTRRGEISARKIKGDPLSIETAQSDLEMITKAYKQTQSYVDAMIYMIQNNAIGAGLTQGMQDGWVATWNGIKSQIQASEASYNGWKAQTLSFFQNYKNTEIATRLAVDTISRELTPEEQKVLETSQDMKLVYQTTLIDLKDRVASAKLALRQAENARDTALKSRSATLYQLSTTRQSGVLSLEQAQREYSKLAIIAPFDGSVSKVIASLGQRVSPGTPIIEVVTSTPEILIDLDTDIIGSLSVGDSVKVSVGKNIFTGSVIALSRTAGANLLYATRISVPEAKGFIGSAANIIFTASKEIIDTSNTQKITLPLKSVKIISEQEGEIMLLGTGNTLIYKSVKLGSVIGESVTIEDALDPQSEIILSDVSNFDPLKFTLERKAK